MKPRDGVREGEGEESLQQQVETKDEERAQRRLFGTFGGVFTPTLLTILGVIMYLRSGWVVGNGGLLGAWIIILIAFVITGFTGLSLSSIVTNIRIGAGGAFSVISQSLGLEIGGAVGVPLYLAQTLAVPMYIFGFREGWLWIFPGHPGLLVDLAIFAVLFALAFISANLAFRVQYLILAVIAGSLVSVAVAAFQGSMTEPVTWWGEFSGSPEDGSGGIGFWAVWAVFFPAATGIMAGANMSGDLENPRRSIPVGTLAAIALSLVIYLLLAYWLARSAPQEALLSNFTVMIDRAAWGPAVVAGLLGATFSSALASLVGAPRILQALGQHNIVPRSRWLSARTRSGEPRNALMVSAVIVVAALMLRDLNVIAPLITLFFLVTYGMINLVVALEQSMGLVSFRPLFGIPRFVPIVGALGCGFAMFIVNPAFSLVAVAAAVAIYVLLVRRHLQAPFGDVRSGLFVAVAEWAAKKTAELTASTERSWKANLLIPVSDRTTLRRTFPLIRDLSFPKGFIKLVGLSGRVAEEELHETLPEAADGFIDEGVFSSWTVVTAGSFSENLRAAIETYGGTFFRPTVLFLTLPETEAEANEILESIETALDNDLGVFVYADPERVGLGRKASVNVWFSDRAGDWEVKMKLGNQDLAILAGYKLKVNWEADLRLVAPLLDADDGAEIHRFLRQIAELARLPNAGIELQPGGFEVPLQVEPADLNIVPMSEAPDFESLRAVCSHLGTPVLFTHDAGTESSLA